MRRLLAALSLGLLAACTARPVPTPAAAPAAATCTDPKVEEEWLQHPAGLCGMPDDVRALVDDYDTCVHFAGEEPTTPIAATRSKWQLRSSARLHRHVWPS
ncbi:exported hypothetical protein [Xanthomonas phaseoli pv. phaseoli]|uniref:Secreted protein n=1 Tax=Xanthomonas campestris pv. phaseoli TaxID=317013 RepID=A0AB38DVW9_XANCH|nr:exported hypothetical protein [Xanthomonas phaseoli pv. phaseoli]SON79620.1 exported hypothetical protein [Xanthomonas phaseoli pv. phaseoli]SON82369.1 exported hypothetical protein [Xanthomonas phaseoli pv. phaseoli]